MNCQSFWRQYLIFRVVKDHNTTAEILNHDLTRIFERACRQKKAFKPDPSKTNHPNIIFNGNMVQNSADQKHIVLIMDEKLTFNGHITSKHTAVNELTSTLKVH